MNSQLQEHVTIAKVEANHRKPLTDVTGALLGFISRSKSFSFEERRSDSPFVESIWRTPFIGVPAAAPVDNCGPFIFPAVRHWGLVITKSYGKTTLTIWGPGTKASPAPCPREADLFGIIFKPGTFMPHLPLDIIRDRRDIILPDGKSKSFWLNGYSLQFPDYENADTFVEWLVRYGLLVCDDIVGDVLKGKQDDLSLRTVQRRFLQATGLTNNTVRQIERANLAKELLERGYSILDTVDQAGYYDQAHLTKSLKNFIGLTPSQIIQFKLSN